MTYTQLLAEAALKTTMILSMRLGDGTGQDPQINMASVEIIAELKSLASSVRSQVLSEVKEKVIGKNERQKRIYSHEIYHRNALRAEQRKALEGI